MILVYSSYCLTKFKKKNIIVFITRVIINIIVLLKPQQAENVLQKNTICTIAFSASFFFRLHFVDVFKFAKQ